MTRFVNYREVQCSLATIQMPIFSSWDSLSAKEEDWHFCLEHWLSSQAWQSESFGDKWCNVQSLVRSLGCPGTPTMCVCSLPCCLPEQADFSTPKGNPGTAVGMICSRLTPNRQYMNAKCIQFDSVHSSQHHSASFLCHFTAPNGFVSCPLSRDILLQ